MKIIINSLNSFCDYENYYKLYTDNNSQLNDIIQNIVSKYNFEFNSKKYYRLNETNIITRNIYELSGLIIMLNAVIEKNFYAYCIKTGKKYKCEKMCYSNNSQSKFSYTTYHFNCSQDEFFILFGWEYFSPICIYYIKNKSIYNISYRFSNIKKFIDESNINFFMPYFQKNNFICYSIGLIHNAGHYCWQEIFGLMLLFEYNLIDKIDLFLIYKYDYLNIAKILHDKFNKRIIYLNDDKQRHMLTINLSKHFINNSLIETFKNIYGLKDLINNDNQINILIDIRTNNRIWLNQKQIIINLMNAIKQSYSNYDINFYISGFYIYDNNSSVNTVYQYTNEIEYQNNIFNFIQKSINFPIHNLINYKLSDIVSICQKINICIANVGSGSSFFYQTIFNKPCVCLTSRSKINIFNLQRYAFENNLANCFFIQNKYIFDNNENFNLQYGVLIPIIKKIIDKIILTLK